MNRFDFLGVPGVGKSSAYRLLGQTRHSPNEFLLFNEAYDLALRSQLPLHVRLADQVNFSLSRQAFFQPFCKPTGKLVDRELSKSKHSFENEGLFDQITEMWNTYPDMLFLRLNFAGRHFIPEPKTEPNDYLSILLKLALMIKKNNLLDQTLPENTTVVIEKFFTQMVFFCVDFSKEVDPEIVRRYIRGIPLPAGVLIFHAAPEVIASRLRQRAKEGRLASFHRDIIDTNLLEEWVCKACEIVQHARACLLDLHIKIYDICTEEAMQTIANNVRESILKDYSIQKVKPKLIRQTADTYPPAI
ncbi:MAG TPA: hypothetical protein VMT91_15875 [Anaerolineales bacterium]|nr:hypothetical protein [Anaerolineales bacterium]